MEKTRLYIENTKVPHFSQDNQPLTEEERALYRKQVEDNHLSFCLLFTQEEL